ncbi:ABC-2 type transport system permease protein [Paenibacillus sp. DS2015]|uniref:ABC transporter permease n=1 Tax=Paenibacillus sp. DS2015 TaxID=3373917 RepID=UPI003D2024A9
MTIFTNTVKRILRNKAQLLFLIIFPFAFTSIGFIGARPAISVSIVDKDQTELTARILRNLSEKAVIRPVEEEDIEKKLLELYTDYVLVIEDGFTDGLIAGNHEQVAAYHLAESNVFQPISVLLEQWLEHGYYIAEAVNHDPELFSSGFAKYDQGALQMKSLHITDPRAFQTKAVLGVLVMAMLYTSLITGLQIIVNKNNGTLYRTLAAPVRIKSYMLQMIGGQLLIAWVQVTFVMLVFQWIYHLYMGSSPINLYILLLLFSFVSVSLGVAISRVSNNMIQACLIGVSLIVPASLLGGAYFPIDDIPGVIQILSQFSPIAWMLKCVEKLLQGQNLISLSRELGILMLFAIIFFLIGSFRKVDLSK